MSSINFLNKKELINFLMAWVPFYQALITDIYGMTIPSITYVEGGLPKEIHDAGAGGMCMPVSETEYVINYRSGMNDDWFKKTLMHETLHVIFGFKITQEIFGIISPEKLTGEIPLTEEDFFSIWVNELITYSMGYQLENPDFTMGRCVEMAINTLAYYLYSEGIPGCKEWCEILRNS